MFQQITIAGRLGAAPTARTTNSGTKAVSFPLAVDCKGSGNQKFTMWVRVTCFSKTADVAEQYLKKGDRALIVGKLSPDPTTGCPKIYTDKRGQCKTSYDVLCDSLTLMGASQINQMLDAPAPTAAQKQQYNAAGNDFDYVDDIPF